MEMVLGDGGLAGGSVDASEFQSKLSSTSLDLAFFPCLDVLMNTENIKCNS